MSYSLKLIDLKTDSYETTFGTCDLCMGTGVHTEEHMIFETSEGKTIDMETGFWDWGDYFYILTVDNTADFAHWLSTQEFEGDAPQDESDLHDVIRDIEDMYNDERESEKYEIMGYPIYNIELSIEVDSYEEVYEEEPVEDIFLNCILDTKGIEDVEGEGHIILFCGYNKNDEKMPYTTQIYGEGFAAKNVNDVFLVVQNLIEETYHYTENDDKSFKEICIWWEGKEKGKTLLLEENDVKEYAKLDKKDRHDFLSKRLTSNN